MTDYIRDPRDLGGAPVRDGRWEHALWCKDSAHEHWPHGFRFQVHPSNFEYCREKYGACYEPVRRWISDWESVVVPHDEERDEFPVSVSQRTEAQ